MTPASVTRSSAEESSGQSEHCSGARFEAVREAYERRERNVPPDKYSRLKPYSILRIQELERGILQFLRRKGISELSQKKILEIGCGDGAWLRFFIQAGASPENLVGVDLLPSRIQAAREKCPAGTTLVCGDASQLSVDAESVDLLLVMTVFSSILDDRLRRLLAQEMLRVLRRRGGILWYDFHVNNPRNPDVRRVANHEIKSLFPDCSIELRPITLAPPLGRAVARAPVLYWLLSNVRPLCSHYLGWITRK